MKRRPCRNSGFTLIEILVVIGIILVLIGIVFVALKHVGGASKSSATKIDLQNLQSMLAELENAGPLTTTIQFPYVTSDARFPAPPNPPYTVNLTLPPALPWGVVGDVTESTYAGGVSNDRWQSFAVYSTQFVMGRLRSVPQTRQSLQSLPGERFVKAQAEGASYGTLTPNSTSLPIRTVNGSAHGMPDPPIMADAWGNPIIFVPGGGLLTADIYSAAKVYKKGSVVNNSGTFFRALKDGKLPAPAGSDWEQLPAGFNPLVTAPGNRPFFASAGPDGDFQSPDDNVYSFEQ
jgi:prepilin-type N-terminal cleavage/methylation domain-containing protein